MDTPAVGPSELERVIRDLNKRVLQLETIDKDTGWLYVGTGGQPAFQSSWVNYDAVHTNARFRRRNGIVYLQGLVRTGTATIFTLPVGFRPIGHPADITSKFIYLCSSDSATTRVDIFPSTGNVTWVSGGNGFVSLSQIYFPAEQ